MRSCPLCEGDARWSALCRLPPGRVMVCSGCGLGWYDGPPPDHADGEILESDLFRRLKRTVLRHEFGYLGRVPRMCLLEIGSGSGALAHFLSGLGHEVVCNDISETNLRGIEQRYGFRTIPGDVMDLDLSGEEFDGIVMRHVFEHFSDPDAAVDILLAGLRPGGSLLVSQPNFDSWCRAYLGKHWSWTVPDHRFFWSESTLRSMFEKHGLAVVRSRSVFSHLGLPLCLARRLPAGLLRVLGSVLLCPVGAVLELLAVVLHKGQNLQVEARKG